MLKLTSFIGRQEAHKLLSQLSNKDDFKHAIITNEIIRKYIPSIDKEIDDILDPEQYIGLSKKKTKEIILLANSRLN